jgi:PAS domain S-box-containing protein
VKSDGSIRNIHALAETLRDEHGNAIRLVGKVEDITERKQAETELRESEVRFRQMFENHDAIMLLIEPHSGLILNANQSAAKFYGYEKPELCAMNINEINILSPEQVAEDRRKALNEERNYFVFPHRLVSGEERIVEVHSSPITFKEKQALLFSIIHDITDRKQAEDALAESEKKFRALFETMSEGIVYENHDGKIISANPAAERLLGLSFDQMQGRTSVDPLWKALHEDGSPFPGETHSLNVAAKTGKPASGEVMGIYNPKSGSYAWLSVNSTPEFLPGEKKPFRAYAVFRDITERKHIEETLEKSEKKFRLLFEEMLSGFAVHEIICDESGTPADYRFLAVNTAFEKMTGLDASNIIGKTVLEVIPETESSWIERYGKVALTGEPIQFEDFAEALGKYYEVRAYRPEHGKFVTIINDITGRKQAEKKVLTTMDDLARSNAELERFAYVASHDLQEPLRMVSSYMQLLERRYKDKLDSDALEFINFAVDGSNRMKILINDLLAYSRVGMRGEELAITNCEEMLANTLTNLQASIEESKAKITHDPLPRVMADGTQLESLFQNLIGNAIKFHGSQPLLIHVGVKKDKNDWVFSVSDNGIGIDPQYFERIFILFQRLHNRQEYSGTGIGLAISKRIVERHGGRIWIESQAEKGSTFFFTLPTKGESL